MPNGKKADKGKARYLYPDMAAATRDYSSKSLKRDAARGIETPSLRSKKQYRRDMANLAYWQETGKTTGKTPERYFQSFDRGAARDAARRARKRAPKRR